MVLFVMSIDPLPGGNVRASGIQTAEADAVLDRVVVSENTGGGVLNAGGDVFPGLHS